jgi:multidrug efflux pump subunit AcrA (membrane-fusion protein)
VDVVGEESGSASTTDSSATDPATTDDTGSTSDSTADDTGSTSDSTADDTGSTSDSTAAVQVRITVPDPGPLAGEAEAAVKVTIEVGASDGKVLTVPMAAIHTSSDGRARVQVAHGDTVTDVHVTVGLSAAGIVEVKPAEGTLTAGERVVVGE